MVLNDSYQMGDIYKKGTKHKNYEQVNIVYISFHIHTDILLPV